VGAEVAGQEPKREEIYSFDIVQGEEPLDTGGGRVFSLDASFWSCLFWPSGY